MQFQKLTFENARGKKLSARLDLPLDRKPTAFAIFAHCFTCTKNFNAVVHINQALTLRGIAVLRFDFTGLGESEGEFPGTNLSTNVEDVVAAAEFLTRDFEAPKLLIGHSMGGAAVLLAAASIPSVTAVAVVAAPSGADHVRRYLKQAPCDADRCGELEVSIAGRRFSIGEQFLEDLERHSIEDAVRNLKAALLIFHSPLDEVVGIEHAGKLFQAARHPKSFVSLDRADHLLSRRADAQYVGSVLGAWAEKYLGGVEEAVSGRDLSDNRIAVRTGKQGYRTEITAGNHSLLADEPIAVGGSDTGPNPYDYLVSALGACTAMTLRMYADRKGLPLDAVVVRLRHSRIHAEDCAECRTRQGQLDHIDREIELVGSLSDEQRERLLEIADRCPVHRTLHSEVMVTSHLKEKDSGADH